MNYREIDLNLLLILDAMYDTGSTTLVAERLKVSQPTVSFSLGKLRDVFGDELFVRHGASMQPTPLAESIREPVRRVIETVRFDILRERAFDPAVAERTFSLSASDIGELVFLPRLLEQLTVSAPKLNLRSLTMPPAELREAMTTGGVDLAIGYFPDLTGAGFFQQKLFEHAFTCLVRADHPVIGDRISMKQFLAADHVVVMQEGRSQEIAERRMAEMGGPPYRAAVAALHERAASGGDLRHHFHRAARGRPRLHAHRPAQALGAAVQDSEHRTQAILAPPGSYRPRRAVAEKSDRPTVSQPRSLRDG
jgi:DNA-binding transcriptional LysR family regulator